MAERDKKKTKTASSTKEMNPLAESFDMALGNSMHGFEMTPFLSSVPSFGGQSNVVAPPPPMSLQQSFAMQASELPPFLREFDELYPTIASAVMASPPKSDNAAASKVDKGGVKMEDDKGDVDRLRRTYKTLNGTLENLEWELKNFIPPLENAQYKAFQEQLQGISRELTVLKKEATGLLSKILLIPTQLELWKTLCSQIELRLMQVDIFNEEITAVYNGKYPANGYGSLVITSQPFPDVVKQKEKKRTKGHATHTDEQLTVMLLTGARSSLVMTSKHVTAELMWDNDKDQNTKGSSSILNPTAVMKKQGGTANFDELRFSKGTGVKIVRLQFHCTAKAPPSLDLPGAGVEFKLESNLSEPFIVMTNESQFSDSAGKLLEQEAFGNRASIPWLRFANLLQLHYLIATRQALNKIGRPLTKTDLGYIWQLKFERANDVTKAAADAFWAWFGKLLHILRHQKPVPEMWEKGLIFGFIAKESAQDLLKGHPVGTFLIRFSEQSAGQFAVACVTKGKRADEPNVIKHHLVPQSTKKLSDYVMSKESFRSVLLCNSEFRVESYAAMAKGTMSKEGAFAEYSTKKDSGAPRLEGYDDLAGDESGGGSGEE